MWEISKQRIKQLERLFDDITNSFGDYGIDLSIEPLIRINYITFTETGIFSKKLRISGYTLSPPTSIRVALRHLEENLAKGEYLDSKDSETFKQLIINDLKNIESLLKRLKKILDYAEILKTKKEKLSKIGFSDLYSFLRGALEAVKENRWNAFIGMIERSIGIKLPEEIRPSIMVYGRDIGKAVVYLLQKAKKRIIIFTQNFHNFRVRELNIEVLDILKKKSREGVLVGIVCRHPENTPPAGRETYLNTLRNIKDEPNIICFLCWHMHMKIVLIDNIVVVGSANFTDSGMHGIGEVAFIIDDKRYVEEILKLYDRIQKRAHYICHTFCSNKKCGYLNEFTI